MKRRIDGVFVRVHKDDDEMLEIYTEREGKVIIWGVVHSDMLCEMKGMLSKDDLNNADYELVIQLEDKE